MGARSTQTSKTSKALRAALINGDERYLLQLLSQPPRRTWFQYICSCCCPTQSSSDELDLSALDANFEDDLATPATCYLASGCLMDAPHAVEAGGQWYSITSAARAKLLQRLLTEDGLHLDFTAVNLRCHNILHCCMLAGGSPEVLQQLLRQLEGKASAEERGVALRAEGVDGLQPLDLALQGQQWLTAALLIRAGALQGHTELAGKVAELAAVLNPPNGPPLAVTPASTAHNTSLAWTLVGGVLSRLPFGVGSMLGSVLGVAAPERGAPLQGVHEEEGGEAEDGATTVLELQQVAEHVKWSIQQVAYVLEVSEPAAAALLAANGYDMDRTVAANMRAPRPAAGAGGAGSQEGAAGSGREGGAAEGPSSGRCIVCFEDVELPGGSIDLGCGHVTCIACWLGVLRARLDEGDMQRTVCPQPGCGLPLPQEAAEKVLPPADLERYLALLAQHYVDADAKMKWCPRPGCGRAVRLEGAAAPAGQLRGAGWGRDVTCSCGWEFCWACLDAPHEPASCQQVVAWKEVEAEAKQQEERDNSRWMERNTRACPQCAARIQRDGGCNHMTCRGCGQHFCWVCGGDWARHGASTGGFYACNINEPPNDPAAPSSASPQRPAASPPPSNLLASIYTSITTAATAYRRKYVLQRLASHALDLPRISRLLTHMHTLHSLLFPPSIPDLLSTPRTASYRPQPSSPHPTPPTGASAPPAHLATISASSTSSRSHPPPSPSTSTPSNAPPFQRHSATAPAGAASPAPPQGSPSSAPAPAASSRAPPPAPSASGRAPDPPLPLQYSASFHSCLEHPDDSTSGDPAHLHGASSSSPPPSPEPPRMPDPLWGQWREALRRGTRVLQWSLVMSTHLPHTSGLRYLEQLQDRLAACLERLATTAQGLPYAAAVLDPTPPHPLQRYPSVRRVVTYLSCAWCHLAGWVAPAAAPSRGGVGSLAGSFLGGGSGRAKEGWVEGMSGRRAKEQALFVMAVGGQGATIEALVQTVNQCCDLVVKGGRQGLFNSSSQVAASGAAAAAAGGGRQQQQQGMQGVGDALVYGFRKMLGV